jgi:hypothetical protein
MFWLTGDVLIPVVVQGPQEAGFKHKGHNLEAAEKTEHWQHQKSLQEQKTVAKVMKAISISFCNCSSNKL